MTTQNQNINQIKMLLVAQKYLQSKAYKILDTNYKCEFGKCDIIATLNNKNIIFIDVSHHKLPDGFPEGVDIDKDKRSAREMVTAKYLSDNDYEDKGVRFDRIAILELKNDKALIRHHINCLGIAGYDEKSETKPTSKSRATQRAKTSSTKQNTKQQNPQNHDKGGK